VQGEPETTAASPDISPDAPAPAPEAAPAPAPEAAPAPAPEAAPAQVKPLYPWNNNDDPKGRKQKTLLMPTREFMMLNYFGDTTYGKNANTIVIEAIRETLARMLKERGLTVSTDPAGVLVAE
jgi:hypothetical protein